MSHNGSQSFNNGLRDSIPRSMNDSNMSCSKTMQSIDAATPSKFGASLLENTGRLGMGHA